MVPMTGRREFDPLDPWMITDLSDAAWQTIAIAVAQELGLFQRLAVHKEMVDLAHELKCSARGVRILVDALDELRLVYIEDETVRLTTTGRAFFHLCKRFGSPSWAFDKSIGVQRHVDAVRSGQREDAPPISLLFQDEFIDMLVQWPISARRAMLMWDQVSRKVNISSLKTMLDLGCGSAVRSLALAQEKPDLSLVLVDFSEVLEIALQLGETMGVRTQLTAVPADLRVSIPPTPIVQGAFIGSLIHFLNRVELRELLLQLADRLSENGWVIIAGPINRGNRAHGKHGLLQFQLLCTVRTFELHDEHVVLNELKRSGFRESVVLDDGNLLAIL